MHIGVEAQNLCGTVRGIGYYTLTLLEALKNQNLTSFHSKNLADLYFPEISHFHFRKHRPYPFYNSLTAFFHSHCYQSIDLLHFPEPKILYGKKPKVPFVLTIHDVMPLLFPQSFPKKSYLLIRYFLPRYLRQAEAIIAVSYQTRKDLLQFFPFIEKKLHVIPCTLLPKKRVLQEEKESFLLYVGSFEPRKNLIGMIQAFHLIKKMGYPHKFVIIGKEEKGHRLPHSLIKDLRLEKEILLKGYVTEEEKAMFFQKASLLLWPTFYEGFGLPLLEAMASGTPILTSDRHIHKEIVGEAGIFVEPEDRRAIAQGIVQILSSSKNPKSLIEKGLIRAKAFDMNIFRQRHLDLYASL